MCTIIIIIIMSLSIHFISGPLANGKLHKNRYTVSLATGFLKTSWLIRIIICLKYIYKLYVEKHKPTKTFRYDVNVCVSLWVHMWVNASMVHFCVCCSPKWTGYHFSGPWSSVSLPKPDHLDALVGTLLKHPIICLLQAIHPACPPYPVSLWIRAGGVYCRCLLTSLRASG